MEEMNILMSTDNNYVRYSMVTIASLFDNHPDTKFNIFIISCGLDKIHIKEISEYVTGCGHYFELLDIDGSVFSGFPVKSYYTVACYYILLAHTYLPENMERILYLDGDIVVDKNITDFYNTDFEDNYLIACPHVLGDITQLAKEKKKGLGQNGEYFNSGVLIFNLDKFRKNITMANYTAACKELKGDFFLDQGMLNYMFADKTKYMPMLDYNFRYSVYVNVRKEIEAKNIIFTRSIIHYTMPYPRYKPWQLWLSDSEIVSVIDKKQCEFFNISKEANDLVGIWWKYAEKLPLKIYKELNETMVVQKNFFLKSINPYANFIVNQRNELAKTYSFEEDNKSRIKQCMKDHDYLQAMTLCNKEILSLVGNSQIKMYDNLNQQMSAYMKEKKHLLILMSAKDSISGYWKDVLFGGYSTTINMASKFRHSYVALLDNHCGFIYESENKGCIDKSYKLLGGGYKYKTFFQRI